MLLFFRALPGALCRAMLLGALWHASAALAVVDAHSQANTNAPADGAPWLNVGAVNGSSGIYLGDRWALTASHVGYGNIKLAGVVYPYDGIEYHLTNSDGTPTDMFLFHLGAQPPLTNLDIVTATPPSGSQVDMIAYGRFAGSAQTNFGDGNIGFYWTANLQIKNWGNNKVLGGTAVINAGYGDITAFHTVFDSTGQTSDEAQDAPQDSGGGVFYLAGGKWQLAGMIDATTSNVGQPANTACYQNSSYFADLATYRSQILTLMTYGAPPALSVSRSSSNVHISWPNAAAGYRLAASAVLPATSWVPVSPTLAGAGFTNFPATNSTRFFRLQKP